MTVKITTESGAVYFLTGKTIAGGSKNLKAGVLLYPGVQLGDSMLISTPERSHLNPHYKNPSVLSTPIVKMEPVDHDRPIEGGQ